VERFVCVASHDLQEPLRVIVSHLQLLEQQSNDRLDQSGLEFLRHAMDEAARMTSLIENLLRMFRTDAQPADFRPVAAQRLLGAALSNLAAAVEESQAQVDADPLPMVVADAGLLTQVFQNLIANGLKFRVPGSRPRILITSQDLGGDWMFSVRDHGIGIEPEYTERIFGLFERLHPVDEYPGSGVGLAISKRIIERHGGRIWAESQPGEGSVFRFTIPASRNSTPRLYRRTA
jgi:light-regulated signal transduction histidine kinase (bacteriophytochrome)